MTWVVNPALTLLGIAVVLLGYYVTARHQDAVAMRHAKRAQTSLELRNVLLERYAITLQDDSDQREHARLARSLDGHVLRDIVRYRNTIQAKGRAHKAHIFSQAVGGLFVASGIVAAALSVTKAGETAVTASLSVTTGLFVVTVVGLILKGRLGDYTRLEFRPDE